MRGFFNRFRKQAQPAPEPTTVVIDGRILTRRQRAVEGLKNLASDANTAVTTYRCARLARTLRRNEALANAAREELS